MTDDKIISENNNNNNNSTASNASTTTITTPSTTNNQLSNQQQQQNENVVNNSSLNKQTINHNNNNNNNNSVSDDSVINSISIDNSTSTVKGQSTKKSENNNNNSIFNDSQMMNSISELNQNELLNSRNDSSNLKDVNYLQVQVKKLQKLCLSEQDKFTKLQKRLQDSENQRLAIISENNKEIFGLNSQCTKLRAELEKSEAARQSIEYELSIARNSFNKERNIILEKERVSDEILKNFEEKYNGISNENSQLKARLQVIDNEYANELAKIRASLDEKQRFFEKFQTEQELLEKERQTLNSLIKDQDKLLTSMKDDLDNHKEAVKKLSHQLENSKEKEEKAKKENESLVNRIKTLEETTEKEKTLSLERKYNLDIIQVKHKESTDQVKTLENIKSELELNITKLIEQLKENRKELSEEQIKNREMKERFKICETQFKTINTDLSHKLEEKTNTIKSLSKQLSSYEANLNEIKYELNMTKEKQGELDDAYGSCMRDIDNLIKSFTLKDEEHVQTSFKMKQNNLLKSTPCPTLVHSINTLKLTLDEYKRHTSLAFDQLRESKYKLDNINSEYDKFKQIIDSKEKLIIHCEELKNKQENEVNTLRKERVALEEVINSLRLECETLKTSLNREYDSNDTNKKQINRVNKTLKQIEDQKTSFLQSLYKRLISASKLSSLLNSNSSINNDASLENLIENAIINLINSLQKYEDNFNEIEIKFKQKEVLNEETKIKQEEQIKNLTKLLKEKETIFSKQKESLVNYYEQLINDVNSRVKHTQFTVTEAWDKLKDTDSVAKNLDTECVNLKEALSKSHVQIRNLNTSCSLLVGILMPLIRQNKELKEQRRIFEYLYKRLLEFQNQILLLNGQNGSSNKTDQIRFIDLNTIDDFDVDDYDDNDDDIQHNPDDTDQITDLDDNCFDFDTNNNNNNYDTDEFKLKNKKQAAAETKRASSKTREKGFKKKIQKLLNENDAACGTEKKVARQQLQQQQKNKLQDLKQLNETMKLYAKQQLAAKLTNAANEKTKCSKICLFRKAAIAIIAAHRLIYFYNYNLNTNLHVFDSIETRHKFLYSQPTAISKVQISKSFSKSNILKNILTNEYDGNQSENITNVETRKLFGWLTSNNHILLFMDIGHELNRYLYGEESYNNKWDLDDNLVKTTKTCVLKCYSLLENLFSINSKVSTGFPYLASKDNNSLCQRLKHGLNKWMNKDARIARYFSFDKKIQILNESIFELNQRYVNVKMDHDLLRTQLQVQNTDILTANNKNIKSKIKVLEEELGDLKKKHNQMIPTEKYETVCKELELALNREQQAEIILNQQGIQLQELSKKLGEFSNQELQSFKLKEVITALTNELEKKEKMTKTLNKKLQNAQSLNEKLEESTKRSLIDKDVILGYCQSVDGIIQKSLKPLANTNSFYEIIRNIKQITHLDIFSQSIQNSFDDDYYKPSAETVACHNLVSSFCENYEAVLKKVIDTENEGLLLKKQMINLKDELKDALKPEYKNMSFPSSPKFNYDGESDISFRPLPNFTIHDGNSSAFKPLQHKLIKSSTPTTENSSYYS